MRIQCKLAVVLFGFSALSVCAATHYVWQSSPGPAPPFLTWATAATNIQDAVDAAGAGDEIVVTNGTYATVEVENPLVLRSVNGPQVTVIDGGSAVGCVYLTNGATLSGFTLSNGWADNGGGVYCESTNAVLSNCVLSGNSAYGGGGACGGTLNNCTLTGNSANRGGGASGGTLNNCTLTGNSATGYWFHFVEPHYCPGFGGGAADSTLNNCTLTGNSADYGGGAYSDPNQPCTLNNCTVTGNSGGGACSATLNNCTVTGNSGFGASSATLNNCIVYFNSDASPFGGNNYDPASTLNYCCTTPMPTNGVGNISADPQLASASHLSAESPCIGAGSATYASGTDIDGEPWANPPSIGCDEYHAGAVRGPLTVAISADYTNVATGFSVGLTAFIEGRTDVSVWDFGDGLVEVNEPYGSHAWTAPGDYVVALWAYNESYPGGVSATLTIHVEDGLHYVAATSGNPVAPYTSWATAATNIQDAVDVAPPGGTIFVTNGTYAAGGRTTPSPPDGATNRVAVDKPLTVRSVNGPGVTVIQGQMPGAINGYMRCVYLTNAATLVGFTLTDGVAGLGGGVYCESTSAVLSNCVLTGNSANGYSFYIYSFDGEGGGAWSGTLNNCTLTGNSAEYGGGGESCTLNNCTLTGNSANGDHGSNTAGGGADRCTLNNCTLTGNSAVWGGGASDSTLNNCTLTGNSGGGAGSSSEQPCTLNNCVVSGNTGDGADSSTLNNCTVTGNSGWGASYCTLNNCIVYFNSAPVEGNYDSSSTLNYCCTTPLPTSGVGNITYDPAFVNAAAGNYHLSSGSPCINAGNNAYVVGSTDLDGRPRIIGGTVDMGAYEYRALLVWSSSPSPVPPYATWATAATNIQEAVDASLVGDNILVTNGTYATGGEEDANGDFDIVVVDKPLVLSSVNGPSVTVINGGGVVRCVYLTNDAVMVGFTLTNGLAYIGGEQGGGVYCESTSAVLTNCVLSGNTASGCDGGGAYGGTLNNCTLTGNTANREYYDYHSYGGGGGGTTLCTLNNCTLTGNYADEGGGVYSCILNNCTLTGNSAFWPGGGAYSCTLNNCTLTGNSSVFVGGGANGCTLNNCTVTGNSGWGASYCTLNNCIVYFNSDPNGGNYDPSSTLNYCCTTPMPTNGVGNITNAPLFVDYAGGNLRLQSNSPCINSGNNAYVVGSNDLDGNPRIVGGTVDIGAYEYQTPTSIISYAWLQQYGLPTDGSADHADLDGTGMNVYQDWIAGLNPTNALSVLKMTSATKTNNPAGLVVTWESVNTRTYYLQSSTNLAAQPAFSTIQSNIVGQAGTTSYTDTTATNAGPYFYRVGVGN